MVSKANPSVLLLTVLLLTSFVTLCFPTEKAAASPRTITVPDDFSSIQAAIDNAIAGDTVFVKSGIYNISDGGRASEFLTIIGRIKSYNGLTIDKPISLIGQNSTIIMALTEDTRSRAWGIVIESNDVTISGFSILSENTAVTIKGNNTTLTNNIIRLNSTYRSTVDSQGNTVISSNVIEGGYCGIDVNSGDATISNNLIRFSHLGIGIEPTAGNQNIFDNTITNNSIGISFSVAPYQFSHNNIVNCSEFSMSLGEVNAYSFPGTTENVNAAYNYWGTTDQTAIENSIYDHKNDPSLGTVYFSPFLTSPNSDSALEIPYLIIVAIAILVVVILVAVFLKRKHT